METAIDRAEPFVDSYAGTLPEPLALGGYILAAADAAVAAIVCIVAALLAHDVRAGLLASATLITAGFLNGRYSRSFAVVPRDEVYSTIALAAETACVLAILISFAGIDAIDTGVCVLLWTIGASYVAVRWCEIRRGPYPRRISTVSRVDHIGRVRARSLLVKASLRIIDTVLAGIGIIVTAPVLAFIALAIAREDGRPVIFTQLRVGREERDFMMFKFRTMKHAAGTAWVRPGDERITRLGAWLRRTSLDELPQLFNVVAGDMSLVGPRPEMREYADRFAFEASNYPDRHIVPPGITGWAQLYCKRNLQPSDMPDVLQHDLFYVQNLGVHLYATCIVKTVCEVFTHRAV